MNTKEIEELLEKYYEGDTTLADEMLLKEFFSREDVPEHLRKYQSMFRFFTDESNIVLSEENQDESLMRRIELYKAETSISKVHPGKRRLYYLSGIAAGLLILFSLLLMIRYEVNKRQHNELLNPSAEIAFNQTRDALLMVSVGLNTGLEAVKRFETLDNAMVQIQLFNKFYNYQNQFINPERMKSPSTKK